MAVIQHGVDFRVVYDFAMTPFPFAEDLVVKHVFPIAFGDSSHLNRFHQCR